MRETLGCCPPTRDGQTAAQVPACLSHKAGGFTLLELLVVLALMGMLAGLVAPSALRAWEGAQHRAVERDIRLVLAGLPLEAFRSGTAIEVNAPALVRRMEVWPPGWALQLDRPLAYSAEGVARGGQVRVRTPQGRERVWEVEAYTGAITPAQR